MSNNKEKFTQTIFAFQAASTLMMTGIIWFVQVVHYPLFEMVGDESFVHYESRHQLLVCWVVLPLMLMELLSVTVLLGIRPRRFSRRKAWIGFVLLVTIWTSTAFAQVPQHELLASGFDLEVHSKLVEMNWIRTICWSLRSMVIVVHLITSS